MSSDKLHEPLLAALRAAAASPGEHRLYRAGKLAGLFAARTGPPADAATHALSAGLLEGVRSETKGKITTDWVKLTPAGVEYLQQTESPRSALVELRDAVTATKGGVPGWLDGVCDQLQALGDRFAAEAKAFTARLDALEARVDAALRRIDALPAGEEAAPWTAAALAYLDKRRQNDAAAECPLPELFHAVGGRRPDLSLDEFHEGLRRLAGSKALRLVPFAGPMEMLPEPEYALPDGTVTFYYAAR